MPENQVFPSPAASDSTPIWPIGMGESASPFSPDSNLSVTRGVGRWLRGYFPHLLKYNFNEVLLVDGDPAIHDDLGGVLDACGYRVRHAVGESDAAGIIESGPPDFLLIDWQRPAASGTPFYESLRRRLVDGYLYIIAMTAEDRVRNKVQMIAAGADAFLVKPVAPGELLSLLQAGTQIIEKQLRLKELAMHDPLTGLLNRRIFAELQKLEWSRAERHDEPLSCLMIDIDHFKRLNDLYGHVHGDRILIHIAGIMQRIGRKSDILCRYGGDEFCVFMPKTDLAGALVGAERLRKAVESEKQFFAAADSFPTVTIGVATRTEDVENPEALLGKADQALLWAKQHRNCVAAYDVAEGDMVAFGGKDEG